MIDFADRMRVDAAHVADPQQPSTEPPPLTPRQREVLERIQGVLSIRGRPPTIRELCEALGIRSPNGVTGHLAALERHGLIEREPLVSRGIRLVGAARPTSGRWTLPIVGRIKAGQLLEAIELIDELALEDLWGPPEGLGLVAVDGWSLVAEHVRRGDWLVVRGDRRVGVVRWVA